MPGYIKNTLSCIPATAILVHPCTSTFLCILQPRY